MRKRIGIDQDGVIADLHSEWLRRYNYDYNDNLKKEDIKEWNWHKLTHPNCQEKIYTYLDDPEIFANLPVFDNSQDVIERLCINYDVFFITAPFNPNNIIPKYNWLKKHFPFVNEDNFVFTRNKSVANVDWLIDDKADNFKGFSGTGLLFDAAHNKDVSRYIRLKNWDEVEMYFENWEMNQ